MNVLIGRLQDANQRVGIGQMGLSDIGTTPTACRNQTVRRGATTTSDPGGPLLSPRTRHDQEGVNRIYATTRQNPEECLPNHEYHR
jgi:hypothetical protein